MKNPTALRNVTTQGNMDGVETVAMTIDKDGMVILMSMLSNLYSNGNEAVVREYSCNARDSHVEAGQTQPIEVSLPTPLNPQFKVQDYGIGLSHDEILSTYAQYGASTKRESNDQIGAFGIGAKSAFTVGNQFTVTGVKDGEKTIAMFTLNQEGAPQVSILHRGATDEPNGVLVDVGVENVSAVRTAAAKLFKCWQPGTVLVDGEAPDTIWKSTEELAKGVYIDLESAVDSYDASTHFKLVMGGVPYAIPSALWGELGGDVQNFFNTTRNTRVSYVYDVAIGDVDIAPNREELRITPRTRSTIKRMVELTINSMHGWVTKKIDTAPSLWEASRIYNTVCNKLNYRVSPEHVYWHGKALGPSTIQFDVRTVSMQSSGRYYEDAHRNYKVYQGDQWFANIDGKLDQVLFVTEVPDKRANLLRTYAKHMLMDTPQNVIVGLSGKSLKKHWFSAGEGAESGLNTMSFADFWEQGKAKRKSRVSTGRGKTQYRTMIKGDTSYDGRTVDDIADLDMSVVLYTYHFNMDRDNPVHKAVWDKDDIILVKLNSRQKLDVFQRAFPASQDANTYFKARAEAEVAKFSTHDHAILKASVAREEVNLGALKFVREHRAKITNKAVLKVVADIDATSTMSPADKVRLEYLNAVLYAAGQRNPYDGKNQDGDWFKTNLPLFSVILRNVWHATRELGEKELNEALVRYINDTTV